MRDGGGGSPLQSPALCPQKRVWSVPTTLSWPSGGVGAAWVVLWSQDLCILGGGPSGQSTVKNPLLQDVDSGFSFSCTQATFLI